MKTKRIAKLEVYKDFSIGISIAWFSAGVINLFFSNNFSSNSMTYSLVGIVVSWLFLQLAVEYNQKIVK